MHSARVIDQNGGMKRAEVASDFWVANSKWEVHTMYVVRAISPHLHKYIARTRAKESREQR